MFGDGRQTRDFVFVKDVVQANLLAMRAPAADVNGRVFNVGTGKQTSLLDLLDALGKLTGHRPEIVFKAERAGDIRDSVSDISRARRELGYRPEYDIQDGLRCLMEKG